MMAFQQIHRFCKTPGTLYPGSRKTNYEPLKFFGDSKSRGVRNACPSDTMRAEGEVGLSNVKRWEAHTGCYDNWYYADVLPDRKKIELLQLDLCWKMLEKLHPLDQHQQLNPSWSNTAKGCLFAVDLSSCSRRRWRGSHCMAVAPW